MKQKKDFLREKFVEFQLRIAELTRAVHEQADTFQTRESDLYLNLFEVLDAFENLNETIQAKEDGFDKTTRGLAKTIRSIHRKLTRLLKSNHILQIEFPEKKDRMEYCKIVDTRKAANMENETILSVVKHGYIDKQQGRVLRKAEVITVLNR